jgi:tripartite-type tricarboxylate transporter receptor subunit TctC
VPTRKLLVLSLAVAAVVAGLTSAGAQTYPARPITMVVPFPAGGSFDAIARIMAEQLRAKLGQTVVVENVGGATGSIGIHRVVRAAPDGYTISYGGWPTHVLAGAFLTLPFDPLSDLEPVSLVSTNPMMVIARKSMPANNLKELIAWLRANPDKSTQGTAGVGSASHVSGIYFQKDTGTSFQFVPYRGAAPAMQDLIAEQIDFMIDPAANSLPQVRIGSIKAFAVTGQNRISAAPEIPTAMEAGMPEFHIASWQAIWAPKGTPKDIVARLNAALVDILADAAVQKRLAGLGQDVPPPAQLTPAALGTYHKTEIEKWWPLIKAAGVKLP